MIYKQYSSPPFSGRQFQSAYEDGLQISEAHLPTSAVPSPPDGVNLPKLTQGDSEGLVDLSGEYNGILSNI